MNLFNELSKNNSDILRAYYNKSDQYLEKLKTHDERYFSGFIKQVVSLANIYFKDISKLKVLDVGCGTGLSSMILKKYFGNVIGVDISEKFINHANLNYSQEGLSFYISDTSDLKKFKTKFDIILSHEVIEHITNVPDFIDNLLEVLDKKGLIIIDVINMCTFKLPFLDLIKGIARKPYVSNRFGNISWLVKNILISIKKRSISECNFLYKTPVLDEKEGVGGDMDACYYSCPIDIIRYFKKKGLKVINPPSKSMLRRLLRRLYLFEFKNGELVIGIAKNR